MSIPYRFYLIFSDQPKPPCGCAPPRLFLWQSAILGDLKCFDCDPPPHGIRMHRLVRVAQPGEHLDPPQDRRSPNG
jgi:hypothetical protein